MSFPICDFLLSSQRFFGWLDARSDEVRVLDQGRGPYYGITWSSNAVYVLARNSGRGDLILTFGLGGCLQKVIELGRDIDGHQIHYTGNSLYVTATRENALIRINPESGEQRLLNWTGHATDINHINGIGEGGEGHLWVSHDNRKGTPSEIVRLFLQNVTVMERVTIEEPDMGTHNIEDRIVLSSGKDSSIWEMTDPGPPRRRLNLEGVFARGLGRFASATMEEHLLVGGSPILERSSRGGDHPCTVNVISRGSWKVAGDISIPGLGQIHEVRSLADGFAHNGIPFPGGLAQWPVIDVIASKKHVCSSQVGIVPAAVVQDRPYASKPRDKEVQVNFLHGMGDCTMFAHQIPLYVRAGFDVTVGCRQDKRILFAGSGARLVEPQAGWPSLGWTHPPGMAASEGKSLACWNKAGWNLGMSPMPEIGAPQDLWESYCATRLNVLDAINEAVKKEVERFLTGLPRPIVLLHSTGNSFQKSKSLPEGMIRGLYQELLDRIDGTIVLLDWDDRVPRLAHYRVRHLTDDWRRIDVQHLLALFERADLLIGIDSGPLHAARYTEIPALGVFWHKDHHPVRYCLPHEKHACIVPENVLPELTQCARLDYHILTSPGASVEAGFIAQHAQRMLQPARYLDGRQVAADVQLQQMVRDWSRGGGNEVSDRMDRDHGWDVILMECSSRTPCPTIVETGCIRSRDDWRGAGNSTVLLGEYCRHRKGSLLSIDHSNKNCAFAKEMTRSLESSEVVCGDSVACLASCQGLIDLLYLDSMGTFVPGAPEHALREFKAAEPRLHAQSIVVFDDTAYSARGFRGKGASAVPHMLANGWKILFSGYQTALIRS